MLIMKRSYFRRDREIKVVDKIVSVNRSPHKNKLILGYIIDKAFVETKAEEECCTNALSVFLERLEQ